MSKETENSGKPAPKKNKQKKRQAGNLPQLLEVSLSISQLAVVLVGLATTLISMGSGAPLWMTALRGGAAMVSVGLVLWFVNWSLSKGSLEVIRQEIMQELEKKNEESDGVESTVEIKA